MRMKSAQRKRSVNVSIRADLLEQSRVLKINLSRTLEQGLQHELRQIRRDQWANENRQALENYNKRVSKSGVYSEGLRRF